MTQLLSNSLVIALVSITPGTAGKENSAWEERGEEGEKATRTELYYFIGKLYVTKISAVRSITLMTAGCDRCGC